MRQYEILWVPVDKDSHPHSTRLETECGTLDAIENSVVLTVEELRELWEAGRQHLREALKAQRADEPELIVSPNFETYLTSKGITLTDKPTSK